MNLRGQNIIASEYSSDGSTAFFAVNPTNGQTLEPEYCEATFLEVDRAVNQSVKAFAMYRRLSDEQRAVFLENIAEELQSIEKDLISRAHLETALPQQRLFGELVRTVNQIKLIADQVRQGLYLGLRIDAAIPDRDPLPKPDIRTLNVPLGPVAVFGASNFPLAFSVAGGDTASALAAGCPVVVKGHPAHPGTSELAGQAIMAAVKKSSVPSGVFSLLHAQSHDVGSMLVQHPEIRAVAFTGSLSAGRALFDLACSREEPIPVFAEMGSINPIFVLPEAMSTNGETIAKGIASSIVMGVGQFCTAPGLVFVEQSEAMESFLENLADFLDNEPAGTMLHTGVKQNFLDGISRLEETGLVDSCMSKPMPGGCDVGAKLYRTDTKKFMSSTVLSEEIFGPAAMVVVCSSKEELLAAAGSLAGQLTATIHGLGDELLSYHDLISRLEDKAGRLIVNGFPTGVEVCASMHHGGPYPATTDSRSTSVGTYAVKRFLRPVCYQNFPNDLLPEPLRDIQA